MADVPLEFVVPARFPELGALRREASAFLDGSSVAMRERLQLVVSELCTNAIEALANPSAEFTLRVTDLPDCVVVEVEDQGPGFADAISKPGADAEAERGRGLAVVKSLVDDFLVIREQDRTLVRCVLVR